MPFLRYPLGDLVTRGPDGCPCGAQCATIQSIQGRVIDRFQLPGGSTFHPYHLVIPLALHSPWVRQFQIVQEALDRIRIKVVAMPGREVLEEDRAQLRSLLAAGVPESVAIIIECVSEIPRASNGKFRPYFSLLTS